MSAIDIHNALHTEAVTGTARLALLVMAIHADHRSRVAISARDLGRMCGVSAQAASNAVQSLAARGLVQVVEKGRGTAPSVYALARLDESFPIAGAQIDKCARDQTEKDGPGQVVVIAHDEASDKAVPPFPPRASSTVDAAPEPKTPPPYIGPSLPPAYPQNDVGRVLHAAGVKIDPMMPFYWHTGAHRRDLESLIAAAGSLDAVLSRLEARRPDAGAIRRLTALEQYVRGRG